MTPTSPATAPALTHAPVNVKLVRRDLLYPDADQPRKFFDERELQELADSMKPPIGIVNAIVVHPADEDGKHKIITGERRWRAAGLVGYVDVPISIRTAAAKEVALAQLVENHQRANVHPLEEAEAIARVKQLDRAATNKTVASAIGMSERYVQNVLHYAVLQPKVKEAFRANEINAGHADLIARLAPADQDRALKACFDNLYGEDRANGVISVRALKSWIDDNVRLELKQGAPELQGFPELQKVVDAAPVDAPLTLLQVSSHYNDSKTPKGVIGRQAYQIVTGAKCKHVERAVVVLGEDRSKIVNICRARTECVKHWPYEAGRAKATKSRPTATAAQRKADAPDAAAEKRQREKAEAARVLALVREDALEAIRQRAKKGGPVKSVNALLRLIGWNSGSEKRYPNWRALLVDQFAELSVNVYNDKEWKLVASLVKPFGFDLLAIEKELAPKPAPVTKAKDVRAAARKAVAKKATKKSAKKPARKAGAKK